MLSFCRDLLSLIIIRTNLLLLANLSLSSGFGKILRGLLNYMCLIYLQRKY